MFYFLFSILYLLLSYFPHFFKKSSVDFTFSSVRVLHPKSAKLLSLPCNDLPFGVDLSFSLCNDGALLSLKLDLFLKGTFPNLCVVSPTRWTYLEYGLLNRKLLSQRVLFVGSDMDAHTLRHRFDEVDILVVDFSLIFQSDSLNYLLESKVGKKPKILGILTQDRYRSSAVSFQSRWCESIFFNSDSLDSTVLPISQNPPQTHERCLTVFPELNFDSLLNNFNWRDVSDICIQGSDLSLPIVHYLYAFFLENHKNVSFYRFPYPHSIQYVHSPHHLEASLMVSSVNFSAVYGDSFVNDDGQLLQAPVPKHICVLSTLTDLQWRELGYLVQNQSISISVLVGVSVPSEITCIQPVDKLLTRLSSSNPLLSDDQAVWLLSQDKSLSQSLSNYFSIGSSDSSVVRVVVHPAHRLSHFLLDLETEKGSFSYHYPEISHLFEDHNATIIFDNLGCNSILSLELAQFSLMKSYTLYSQKFTLNAKLVCISNIPPPIHGVLTADVPYTESIIPTQYLPLKTESVFARVATDCSLKKQLLASMLITSKMPFRLFGSEGVGKTYFLTELISEYSFMSVDLKCSQILSLDDVEETVFEWLNLTVPAVLVVDHYDVFPDGTWDFLIPDSNHCISIKGVVYPIPVSHRCVFVGDSDRTHSSHVRIRKLSSLSFSPYSAYDLQFITSVWSKDVQINAWLHSCLDLSKSFSEMVISLSDLRFLFDRFRFYYRSDKNIERVKVMCLHSFLLTKFPFQNLESFGPLLPVRRTVWSEYCREFCSDFKDNVGLTKDQYALQRLLSSFIQIYHLNADDTLAVPLSCKPIFWLEGDAGCGKDYIVTQVLETLSLDFKRVKGSDVQSVIECVCVAKKKGEIVVIEEADFLSMDVLRTIVDSSSSHPKFSVIVTVNGLLYTGRHILSRSLVNHVWSYVCGRVDSHDLDFILRTKFSDSLSADQIKTLLSWYDDLKIFLSPREIFSVVDTFLSSDLSLKFCWDSKLSFLSNVRDFISNTQIALPTLPEGIELEDSCDSDFVSYSSDCVAISSDRPSTISGMGLTVTSIRCASNASFLPFEYFVVDASGNQFLCSGEGTHQIESKSGIVCLDLSDGLSLFTSFDQYGLVFLLPIPAGTSPKSVTLVPSDRKSEAIHFDSFFKDRFGFYFIRLNTSLNLKSYFMKIHYGETKSFLKELDGFCSLFEGCDFCLPEELTAIFSNREDSPAIQLQKLYDSFNLFFYDISVATKKLYEDACSGQLLVQKFLDLKLGCCYEASFVFSALVSRYLKFPVRLVSGYQRSSSGQYGMHLCAEVCVDNVWQRFDVSSRLSLLGHRPHNRLSVLKNQQDKLQNVQSGSVSTKDAFDSFSSSSYTDCTPKKPSWNYFHDILKHEFVVATKHWCYVTNQTQSKFSVSNLLSSSPKGRLNLSVFHRSAIKLYQTMQIQPSFDVPDIKVLLSKSDFSFTFLNCHLAAFSSLNIPVFVRGTDQGFKRMHSFFPFNVDEFMEVKNDEAPSGFVHFSDLSSCMIYASAEYTDEQLVPSFFNDELLSKHFTGNFRLSSIDTVRRFITFFQQRDRSHSPYFFYVELLCLSDFSDVYFDELTELINLLKPAKLKFQNMSIPKFHSRTTSLTISGDYQLTNVLTSLQSFHDSDSLDSLSMSCCKSRSDFELILKNLPLSVTDVFCEFNSMNDPEPFPYLPSGLVSLRLKGLTLSCEELSSFMKSNRKSFPNLLSIQLDS